jgi:hypothetical protein
MDASRTSRLGAPYEACQTWQHFFLPAGLARSLLLFSKMGNSHHRDLALYEIRILRAFVQDTILN